MPKQTKKPKSEERVPHYAERLWRQEGAPAGRMDDYLERARELLAIQEHPTAGLLPNSRPQHGGAIPPETPVEGAALVDNLGEFPSQLTDPGDRRTVPMVRKRVARVTGPGG